MPNDQRTRKLAVIREAECIGCTKCLQACPVDAIVGSATFMHTVISDECIGCELCIAPCPVDCIDMLPAPALSATERQQQRELARTRIQHRRLRLQPSSDAPIPEPTPTAVVNDYIAAAIARVKRKREQRGDHE